MFLTMAKCQKDSIKENDMPEECETQGTRRCAQEDHAKIEKGRVTLGHLGVDVRKVLK
jgi:hypothetical protein